MSDQSPEGLSKHDSAILRRERHAIQSASGDRAWYLRIASLRHMAARCHYLRQLTITLNPTNSFALIVICEAISTRIGSLARMLSGALRCAGAVALVGFRRVWGGDRSKCHS